MKDEAQIKDATKQDQSSWKNMIDEIADKYHVKETMGITKKNIHKTLIQKEIEAKINRNIENETEAKTKVKHWRVRTEYQSGDKTQVHGQTN